MLSPFSDLKELIYQNRCKIKAKTHVCDDFQSKTQNYRKV